MRPFPGGLQLQIDMSRGPQTPWKEGRQMEVSDSYRDLFLHNLIGCWIYVADVERLFKVMAEA